MLGAQLEELWPLSKSYEYAAELGLTLRMIRSRWWTEFTDSCESLPVLPQAVGYSFLRFLESGQGPVREELLLGLYEALDNSAGRLAEALRATVADRSRPAPAAQRWSMPEIADRELWLFGGREAAGRRSLWVKRALEGARVLERRSIDGGRADLQRVHDARYLAGLTELAESGGAALSPSSAVGAQSLEQIRAGAGALISATETVIAAGPKRPLVLCTPALLSPQAESNRAAGGCLVNQLAVCAAHALSRGLRSVAIVDVGARHGSGAEQIFREDPRVFTLSIHQQNPFFPGTGERREHGHGRGLYHNLNLPFDPADGPALWLETLAEGLKALRRQRPELLVVSWAADAHRADRGSDLGLNDADFVAAASLLAELGCPAVFELGRACSERPLAGALRALVSAWGR
jgi:acetoin utilization deacetylase AcuC-like enzyme